MAQRRISDNYRLGYLIRCGTLENRTYYKFNPEKKFRGFELITKPMAYKAAIEKFTPLFSQPIEVEVERILKEQEI